MWYFYGIWAFFPYLFKFSWNIILIHKTTVHSQPSSIQKPFYIFSVKQKGLKTKIALLAQHEECSISQNQTPYLKYIKKETYLFSVETG